MKKSDPLADKKLHSILINEAIDFLYTEGNYMLYDMTTATFGGKVELNERDRKLLKEDLINTGLVEALTAYDEDIGEYETGALQLNDKGIRLMKLYGSYPKIKRALARKRKWKRIKELILKSLTPLQTLVTIGSISVATILSLLLFRKEGNTQKMEQKIDKIESKLDSVLYRSNSQPNKPPPQLQQEPPK